MKRLFLLRHAKSVQDGTHDRERALSERGRHDAPRMGAYMQHNHYAPEFVLCSSARRTTETWQLIAPELDHAPEAQFEGELYLATASTMLKIIRGGDNRAASLLVIGHNPGLEDCAVALARQPDGAAERTRLATMKQKYPTCALGVFDFDIKAWQDLAAGTGRLADFARPKNLED